MSNSFSLQDVQRTERQEFPCALDLGHVMVAIPPSVNLFSDVIFLRERVYVQNWLKD